MSNAKTVRKNVTVWKAFSLIAVICFLVAVPPLSAQDYGQDGQQQQRQQQQQQQYDYQQQQQQQPTDFSDKDLEKFAEAKVEIDEIRSEFSEELGQVNDADKARELQDKYGQQMIESIEEKDLSVQKYNQISQAMQADSELQQKVEELAN